MEVADSCPPHTLVEMPHWVAYIWNYPFKPHEVPQEFFTIHYTPVESVPHPVISTACPPATVVEVCVYTPDL